MTLTKHDLVTALAHKHKLRRLDAQNIVEDILQQLYDQLAASGKIEFRDFLSLEVVRYAARGRLVGVGEVPRQAFRLNVKASKKLRDDLKKSSRRS